MSRLLIIACLFASCLAVDDESQQADLVSGSTGSTGLPKCIVCSTAEDGAACMGKLEGETLVFNESLKKPCTPEGDQAFTVCRKITQMVRGEETVIRKCGYELWKGEEENCYKTLHQEFNTLVCTCTGKGKKEYCNSASVLSLSVMAAVATIVVAIMAS